MSRIVDMTLKTSKGTSEITRLIKVLVSTIQPFECVLTISHYLLEYGKMSIFSNEALYYSERFRSPFIIDKAFKNIALFKISMDAGGGSTKYNQSYECRKAAESEICPALVGVFWQRLSG